jgi:hypothetical protein
MLATAGHPGFLAVLFVGRLVPQSGYRLWIGGASWDAVPPSSAMTRWAWGPAEPPTQMSAGCAHRAGLLSCMSG